MRSSKHDAAGPVFLLLLHTLNKECNTIENA